MSIESTFCTATNRIFIPASLRYDPMCERSYFPPDRAEFARGLFEENCWCRGGRDMLPAAELAPLLGDGDDKGLVDACAARAARMARGAGSRHSNHRPNHGLVQPRGPPLTRRRRRETSSAGGGSS